MLADHSPGRRAPMTATTTQPRSLSVATIHLAAVLTAVPCARMFVRHTLERWRLKNMVADAELVVSELATNSIRATGITDPEPKWQDIKAHHVLGVQLRVTNNSAFVEIWDRSTISPNPKPRHSTPKAVADSSSSRPSARSGASSVRRPVARSSGLSSPSPRPIVRPTTTSPSHAEPQEPPTHPTDQRKRSPAPH